MKTSWGKRISVVLTDDEATALRAACAFLDAGEGIDGETVEEAVARETAWAKIVRAQRAADQRAQMRTFLNRMGEQ